MANVTSEPALNITIFRRDIYNGYHLIPYLGLVAPALVLSVLTTLAFLLARDTNKKIRALLINIFVAEIVLCLRLSVNFLAYPIRQMFEIGGTVLLSLCRLQISLGIIAVLAKVGSIALYAVMVYIFIKYNIKKVKWFILAIPIAVTWVIAIGFCIPVAVRPRDGANDIIIFDGFCLENLESEEEFEARRRQFTIQLVVGWLLQGVFCGGIIITFCTLLLYFMKKTSVSEGSKRAIAKNLLFLSVDALLSIFVGVVLPTVSLLAAPDPSNMDVQRGYTQASVQEQISTMILSLVSLYTPLVTIVLLKPVRDATRQLVVKCCQLY